MSIGENIRELRKEKGMSQSKLASLLFFKPRHNFALGTQQKFA